LEGENAKGKQNSNGLKGGASISTQNDVITDDSGSNDGKQENKNCAKSASQITETTTFVENFFGGQLCSTICCQECGHSLGVYEPIIDLSLSQDKQQRKVLLIQLLQVQRIRRAWCKRIHRS
jgi:hypothetical protein